MAGGFVRVSDGEYLNASHVNDIAADLEGLAEYILGGGIIDGFDLSEYTGLNLTIGAGVLLAKKVVVWPELTIAVTAGVTRYIWVNSDVTKTAAERYTLTPTAASPGSGYRCIGQYTADGSAITSTSQTGAQKPLALSSGDYTAAMIGGIVLDMASEIVALKKLIGNGQPIDHGYVDITGAKSDADYALAAGEYVCETIRLGWTGWTSGHNVIIPAVTGAIMNVINATGQAATIKAATGTGVAIANGDPGRVLFDGTNVVSLLP